MRLGVSSTLDGLRRHAGAGRRRAARAASGGRGPAHAGARRVSHRGARLGRGQPARAWRAVSWRNGTQPAVARPLLCALRVTPAHEWRDVGWRPRSGCSANATSARRRAPSTTWSHLPATASLRALVRLAHQRWAIEQQYQELKDELGLDHFEGRSLPGWQRHVVLTALAYTWLQRERRRRGARLPTLPLVRAVITEILTAHFFVTHPHYLDTMLKLAEIHLRI